jgi:hypothetical protein
MKMTNQFNKLIMDLQMTRSHDIISVCESLKNLNLFN